MLKSLIIQQSRPTDRIAVADEYINVDKETHLFVHGMVIDAKKSPFVKRVTAFNKTVYLVNIDLMMRIEASNLLT
jgi:hypothetical protein